jgi:S-DNA-T family DNA segregation ATPase FtsK/SpoIIIE
MPTPSPSLSVSPARISLPAPPAARESQPFPTLATIAPVVVSLAMWAVTRSPFALMFAAFGPVMAIAGYLDAGVGGRRRYRSACRRHAAALADIEAAVTRAHETERRGRFAEHPPAALVVAHGRTDARWRVPHERATLVSIGRGSTPSTLRIDGTDDAGTEDLRQRAATIEDVPVAVDARHGIGVVGPLPLARAVARGLLVQVTHAMPPDALTVVSLPSTGWDEFRALPHLRARSRSVVTTRPALTASVAERTGEFEAAVVAADLRIVVARSVADLPSTCVEIVECESPLAVRWRRADAVRGVTARPDPVSAPDARRFAEAMESDAVALGLSRERNEPPESLRFDELPGPEHTSVHRLAVPLGATSSGPLVVDLVADGPHAVIGGTTGSGKSELLITWVVALASAAPADQVSLLLFDFKGGATFGALSAVPNVVGLVTDLDEATAVRALESLRAEVRHRERWLHESGLRDIRDAADGAMPRLVIVVDEFAAMIETFPDLHAVFVDLAARGRSLGVHLVLCTQRPASAVRDGVLANCDIRISLRVNNAGDSLAVVGSPDAATLPSSQPGRVIVSLGGRPGVIAQIATTTQSHIDGLARRSSARTVRRPWLDPLPGRIPLEGLSNAGPDGEADGFRLGRFDLPGEQRQPVARYRPEDDGHLLVLGAAGRGTSTVLAVVGAQSRAGWAVQSVPVDPESAWDALQELGRQVRTGDPGVDRVLVLIDDLDLLMARWGDDYSRVARDELSEILRAGPGKGIHVVLAAHRATGDILALASLVGSTLRLGAANKQEHVLSGGDGASYRSDRRPGSGTWRGRELQVAIPDGSTRVREQAGTAAVPLGPGLLMIVTRRPALRARWARERGAEGVLVLGAPTQGTIRVDDLTVGSGTSVVVGELDAWQQQWALCSALRSSATVVVEDATVSEWRALTRRAELPPWVAPGSSRGWLLRPDGQVERVSFDTDPGAAGEPARASGSRRSARRVSRPTRVEQRR